MTHNDASSASKDSFQGSIDPPWVELAPPYVEKIAPGIAALMAVLVLASPVPALMHYPNGGWIAFVGPMPVLFFGIWWSGRKKKFIRNSYVDQLLEDAGIRKDSVHERERASAAFDAKSKLGNIQATLMLCSMLYLILSYSVIVIRNNEWGLSFHGAVSLAGDLITWIPSFILAVLYSLGFAGALKSEKIVLSDLRPNISGLFSLRPEDRNDIDIAGLGVALQALMRRAEAYTVESTLLSALSFSAFVGIAFSDQGPIEDSSWIKDLINRNICKISDRESALSCLHELANSASLHVMYIVSATLLITSVLLIGVLVIRFKFNEAYKYAEEILCVAKILNEKESNSNGETKVVVTAEIDKTLSRAQMAIDDLRPLGNAMKNFRNLGILFFVSSVSLCGLYFHWFVAVALCLVVSSAYIVTYVDGFRRKIAFFPKLESVAMSVWHRKI